MVRLSAGRRALLADKVSDVANVAAGAMVFGQFLSDRPFSISRMLVGGIIWMFLVGCAVAIREGKEPWKAR